MKASAPMLDNVPTFAGCGLLGSISALLGWSVWARGGTVVALQGPLPWIGLVLLVFLLLDRWDPANSGRSLLRPLCSDVVFLAGLSFLVLLTVQWWNAGRHPYFHPFDQRWVLTPTAHPGWPWAVDRDEAAEMLRWFFPAWALMLTLRHARNTAWLAKRVAWFLVCNAGLLALFGIAQTLSGTHQIFWLTPMSDHFFASFGYENHAASYFALIFALAAGMLLQRVSLPGPRVRGLSGRPSLGHLATVAICAVLCLAGMALSFSRTGMALAVGLSGVALIVAARLFWPRVSFAQRVAVVAALIMGVATFFFVMASIGGGELAQKAALLPQADIPHELTSRLFMVRSAGAMWLDNPWFGVGGWGYRHFLPLQATAEHMTFGPGDANVHNDAAQFLCEFGAVGLGLMLAATLAFMWPLLRQARHHLTPGLALAGMGLLAVLFHSLLDLPFRSPGILNAWLAVCGVAQVLTGCDTARIPRPCLEK
jgi:O-antigen ligase